VKHIYIIAVIITALATNACTQFGQNTWVKTYGGRGDEQASSIVATPDSGYVITGWTSSADQDFQGIRNDYFNRDIFVVRLDGKGNILWKKVIGGKETDEGTSIALARDGGFILTGRTASADGDFVNMQHNTRLIEYLNKRSASGDNSYSDPPRATFDVCIIKIDDNGAVLWKRSFGGTNSEAGRSISSAADGGCFVVGETNSKDGDISGMNKTGDHFSNDIIVVKLDNAGNVSWKNLIQCELNSTGMDVNGCSVSATADGGCVVTGPYSSADNGFDGMSYRRKIYVCKYDKNGALQWRKTYGGSIGEKSNAIITTSDNGYVLTGYTYSNDGDFKGLNKGESDVFVLKLNESGNIQWRNCIGGKYNEEAMSISSTPDGGYVVTGFTKSNDGDFAGPHVTNENIFVAKLNDKGLLQWKKVYMGSVGSGETGSCITTTLDSGYVLTGWTSVVSGDELYSASGKVYSKYGDLQNPNKGGLDIFVMRLDSTGYLRSSGTEILFPTAPKQQNTTPKRR
jgi:hypothetical protein